MEPLMRSRMLVMVVSCKFFPDAVTFLPVRKTHYGLPTGDPSKLSLRFSTSVRIDNTPCPLPASPCC